MKKRVSLLGTILFMATMLLPLFQPVLNAFAEDGTPKLMTVYHNGSKVKDLEGIEDTGENIIDIKATGNFTLTIPESEDYEIYAISKANQKTTLSKAKKNAKYSFDVGFDEEAGYQFNIKKGTTTRFAVALVGDSATLNGTAAFGNEKLSDIQMELLQLVKPQEENAEAETIDTVDEVAEETIEETPVEKEASAEEENKQKQVIFYNGDEKIDENSTISAEEGQKFNPTENITAKSEDGSQEYQVQAEVKKEGKDLPLSEGTFVPELETNYLVQYSALEEKSQEVVATKEIGLLAVNENLKVTLEWRTDDSSQRQDMTLPISQTDSLNAVTYILKIETTGNPYKAGEIKVTLPKDTIKFSNMTGFDQFHQWHKDNIGVAPVGDNDSTFAYEVGENDELIITNQKPITGTIQQTIELSMRMADRPTNGIRARMIYDGTNTSFAFNVEDTTQTDPEKRNFKTNNLKLTLTTSYTDQKVYKSSLPYNPYEWDTENLGTRPSEFKKYNWAKFVISATGNETNGRNLILNFIDKLSKVQNNVATPLTKAQMNNLQIYGCLMTDDSINNNQYYIRSGNAGLDDRKIDSSGQITWTSKTNRNHTNFTGSVGSNAVIYRQEFVMVVGFPRDTYPKGTRIRNEIAASYYDGDNSSLYYGNSTASTNVVLDEYNFEYIPDHITRTIKKFAGYQNIISGTTSYYIKGTSRAVNKDMVVPLLKAGSDVELRSARVTYSASHSGDPTQDPYTYEMTDDHMKWKTTNSGEAVPMTPDDFYFSEVSFQTESLLPNGSTQTYQADAVKLPYLQIQYQDDDTGWKTHKRLISPTVQNNAGTDTSGNKYTKYSWGYANSDYEGIEDFTEPIKLEQNFGIKPYRLRFVTVDSSGNKLTSKNGIIGRVVVNAEYQITLKGVNPDDGKNTQLEKWIADKDVNTNSLQIFNFSGLAVSSLNGDKATLINNDDEESNDRFESDIDDYGDYIERSVADITVTEGDTKSFIKKQNLGQTNETKESRYKVDWGVNWAEGYDVGGDSTALEELFESGKLSVPNRNMAYLRDLLPRGHSLDRDSLVLKYRGQTLNDGNEYDITTTENYKSTGRTLVQITIYADKITNKSGYLGQNSTSSGVRIRGNTIEFNYSTLVAYADRSLANENSSTYNRNSATVQVVDKNSSGVAVPGTMLGSGRTATEINNELISVNGLNDSGAGYANVVSGYTGIKDSLTVYAAASFENETAVESGLTKYVKSDAADAQFGSSDSSIYLRYKKYYYRLDYHAYVATSENSIKNVILFDQLEIVKNNKQGYSQGWRGILSGVDTSYAKSKGIDAKVYVNDSLIQPFAPGQSSLSAENGWRIFNANDSLASRGRIQTVAVDLTMTTNNEPKVFTTNEYINIPMTMSMPSTKPTDIYAYNVPWLSASRYTSNTLEENSVTEALYTDFRLKDNIKDLKIVKQDINDSSKKLNNVVFELSYPDGNKKDLTTSGKDGLDDLGQIILSGLTVGDYTLREKSTINGYQLLEETYSFSINANGAVYFDPSTTYWKYKLSGDQITLTVNNDRKVFELPITGGSGAAISITLIIAIIIVLGSAWYLKKYRFTV